MLKRLSLAILVLSVSVPSAFAAETLEVSVGYSQVIGPVQDMATVVVGNNGVAEVTLGGGGTLILTGKNLGTTNLIVMNAEGRELLASPLRVVPQDRRPTTTVRVTKGVDKARDYVCAGHTGCAMVAEAVPPVVVVEGAGSGAEAETPEALEAVPQAPAAPESPETDGTVAQEQVSLNP